MFSNEIRKNLQNIAGGTLLEEQGDHCTTIRNLLCKSFGAGPVIKSEFESRAKLKKEQAEFLRSFAERSDLLLTSLPATSQYLTKGGEARVYLDIDSARVIKVNDAIYYATWGEYFDSLTIHNLLFPGTSYSFLGFTNNESGHLCAVVTQSYIEGGQADLNAINSLLSHNGFINTKRQDYYNTEFRLQLEDMHDENVIAKNDVLFFIDTVFYIL